MAGPTVSSYWYDRVPNLGDVLAPVVLAWATGATPVHAGPDTAGKVLGVGSNLSKLAPGDVVWGAGALWDTPIAVPPGVRVLAVRGPRTAALLRGVEVPEVYGDPALLLPIFHYPADPSVEAPDPPAARPSEIGLVPHYADRAAMTSRDPAVRCVDVTAPWQEAVAAIAACDVVVSSSLHGLVVAEAYGVPAVWVRAGDRVLGGSFKFDDHYLGTGRDARPPVPWEAGLAAAVAATAPPPRWDPAPLLAAAADLPVVPARR